MSREQIDTNKFMIHSIDFVLIILSIIATLFSYSACTPPPQLMEAPASSWVESSLAFSGDWHSGRCSASLSLEVYELMPHS